MASLKKPLAERKFENIKIGNHNYTDPYFSIRILHIVLMKFALLIYLLFTHFIYKNNYILLSRFRRLC